MKRRIDEQELLDRLAQLPRERTPRSDAWPAIARRLQPRDSAEAEESLPRIVRGGSIAAALLTAIGVGWLVGHQFTSPNPADQSTVGRVLAAQQALAPVDWPVRATGELEYQAAVKEFMAVTPIPGDHSRIDSESFSEGWLVLLKAEAQLVTALEQKPNDLLLNNKLLSVRTRQLDLLKDIAAIETLPGSNAI